MILSACYTTVQAEALLAHVECVVGIGGRIHPDGARNFAIGFYGGLGEQESVEAAYKQGCAAISLDGLGNSDHPLLKVRAGVDANQLVLAAEGRTNTTTPSVGALRHLVYLSRIKLDMLTQQMPMQESNRGALDEVIYTLRRQGLIGTIEEPGEYFEGKLKMSWSPVAFYVDRDRCTENDDAGEEALRSVGSMVLFLGKAPTNVTVAMIGSSRHLMGDSGSSRAEYMNYINPAFWAKIAAGVAVPNKEINRGLHSTWYDIYWRVGHAPGAAVAFLAKTFSRPPLHPPLFRPDRGSQDEQENLLLLGSPLFVALA